MKNAAATNQAYGAYVTPCQGDAGGWVHVLSSHLESSTESVKPGEYMEIIKGIGSARRLPACPAGNAKAMEAALKGARAVICTGRLGSLLELPQARKVEHLIVLSSAGGQWGRLCHFQLPTAVRCVRQGMWSTISA